MFLVFYNLITVYFMMLTISIYLMNVYQEYMSSFIYAFLIIRISSDPRKPWVENGIILKGKNLDFSGSLPKYWQRTWTCLQKSHSVISESLQVFTYVCSHTCLSTIISTGNGYTLETSFCFHSRLDTLLPCQTPRDNSVSASHPLSAIVSSFS